MSVPSRRSPRAPRPLTLTAAVLAAGLLACETPAPLSITGEEAADAAAEVRTGSAELHLGPEGARPDIYVDGERVDPIRIRSLDAGTIERIEVVRRRGEAGTIRITLKESPGT